MENLASYLTRTGKSQRAFAAEVGVDPSVLSRFISNAASPSLKTAVSIERATDGAVPASIWVDGARATAGSPSDTALPDGVSVLATEDAPGGDCRQVRNSDGGAR